MNAVTTILALFTSSAIGAGITATLFVVFHFGRKYYALDTFDEPREVVTGKLEVVQV